MDYVAGNILVECEDNFTQEAALFEIARRVGEAEAGKSERKEEKSDDGVS